MWSLVVLVRGLAEILGVSAAKAIGIIVAGLLTFDTFWLAFIPAATYLGIHATEGAVTPLLLARRFELNPVLVIISLVFWFWMWGIAGALLAVPLLASFKIICDRIRPLMALGHFVGGENHSA